MGTSKGFFFSSIGRKYLMGLTGLALSGFVLTHMAGNLLMFCGAESYNKYGHAMVNNPAIYFIEAGLVFVFLVHIISAISLTRQNKAARPVAYAATGGGDKDATLAAKTMVHTGMVTLIFVVYHLITFKFGPVYWVTYDGVEMRDLARLLNEVFSSPGYVAGYVFCMIILCMHLMHGFSSAFQSLGINHPKYTPLIKKAGVAFALIVSLGFISQPLYVFLKGL